MPTVQHQLGAVFDDPLDGFTAREFQRLGQGGREVDVPLLTGFALNELDFGGVTHVVSLSSYITRYQNTPQCFDPARVFIPLARSRPLKCGNLSSQTPNSRRRHSCRRLACQSDQRICVGYSVCGDNKRPFADRQDCLPYRVVNNQECLSYRGSQQAGVLVLLGSYPV